MEQYSHPKVALFTVVFKVISQVTKASRVVVMSFFHMLRVSVHAFQFASSDNMGSGFSADFGYCILHRIPMDFQFLLYNPVCGHGFLACTRLLDCEECEWKIIGWSPVVERNQCGRRKHVAL